MVKRASSEAAAPPAKKASRAPAMSRADREASQMKRAQELAELVTGHGASHVNHLVELVDLCGDDSMTDRARHSVVQSGFRAVDYVLREVLVYAESGAAHTAYKWGRDRFEDYFATLLSLLSHREAGLQVLSLSLLVQLVRTESHLLTRRSDGQFTFASDLYRRVIAALVRDHDHLNDHVVSALCDRYCGEYDDLCFFTYASLRKILSEDSPSALTVSNVFVILQRLTIKTKQESLGTFFCTDPPADTHPLRILREHRRVFSDCWLQFLRMPLTLAMYKRVLVIIYKDVYPHLIEPNLLTDFFTDSYNAGGIVSVLSLNGIFILMTKNNLCERTTRKRSC